ncbi:MAG TPA: tetratricopeptide repeat protein [Clostridia bacterium]|nr:tetratricopeptide repeat protein [Clostridia bacterium]
MTLHKSNQPGKVLSFEQKGEFFYKRGLDRLDENKLAEALCNYRLASARDPGNEEVLLAMAEVLTEMERYDESNRILFALMRREEYDSECYFGLGCNFMGLNDVAHAKDAFERYVELEPEGEFVYDAYDMLDAIEEAEFYREGSSSGALVEVNRKDEAYDAAEEGREFLEQEHYDKAEEKLLTALRLDPDLHWARNNLTLVYFCRREHKRAANEAKTVLEREPKNLQALCNLAMVQQTMRDKAAANRTADAMARCEAEDPDDLNRMSLVLMDLSRYAEALPLMRKLRKHYPYDEGSLHRLALCAFQTEQFAEAVGCYDTLLKINAQDTIARYYRGLCRAAQASGGASNAAKRKFMLNYQVPFDEMLARINRLNEIVGASKDGLEEAWENNAELKSLVEWGFTLPDRGIKRALITLISTFQDARGEEMLRDFILRRDQPDELKHEALASLTRQEAKEPYIAYLGGVLVQSRVSHTLSGGVSKPYRDALVLCLSTMRGRRPDKVATRAVSLWEKYIHGMEETLPRLSRAQASAMAAALEYVACREVGEKAVKTDICARYGVSALRFKNALTRLEREK